MDGATYGDRRVLELKARIEELEATLSEGVTLLNVPVGTRGDIDADKVVDVLNRYTASLRAENARLREVIARYEAHGVGAAALTQEEE